MFDGMRARYDESRFKEIIDAALNGQLTDDILKKYKKHYSKFWNYFSGLIERKELSIDEIETICKALDSASILGKDEFWRTHSLSWKVFELGYELGFYCKWLHFDQQLFDSIIVSAKFYKVPIESFLKDQCQYMAFVCYLDEIANNDRKEMSKKMYADVYSNLGIELPSFLGIQKNDANFMVDLFNKITMQPGSRETKELYDKYIGIGTLEEYIFLDWLIEKEEKKEITKEQVEQVDKFLSYQPRPFDEQIRPYDKVSNYRKIAKAVTSAILEDKEISDEIKDECKNIFEALSKQNKKNFEMWFHFSWMPKLLRDGRIQGSEFTEIYQQSLSKMNEVFSADFSVTNENGEKQIQKEVISAANKVQVAGGQIIMDSLESQDPMLIPANEESSKQTQEEVVSAEQTIRVDKTKDRADSLASESGVLDSIEADKHEISTNGNDKSSTSSDEGVNGDGGEVPLVEIPSSGEDGKDSPSALASESGDEALEADYEIPDNGNDKPSTGSDEGVNGDGGEVPLVEIPSSGEDEKDSSSALASESGDEALEADAYEISEKGNDKSSTSSDEGVNGDGGEESSEGSDEEVHENDGKGSPTDSDEEIHGNDGKGFPTGLDNGKDNTPDEQVLSKTDSKVADSFLHLELASYLSGDPVNEKIIENLKQISDKDMVIDAIVESLSKVDIEDEEKRNAIVGRASNLLQTLSEDSKDLYATLEAKITSEISELYKYYDELINYKKPDEKPGEEIEKQDALYSKIHTKQLMIDALCSISNDKYDAANPPYITASEYKKMSEAKDGNGQPDGLGSLEPDKKLLSEIKNYLSGVSGAKIEFNKKWKEISDDSVINAIVDSLSKVGIEDEEKRNAIVGRASNLLQTLSTEKDSKDLYELLEERITAEIKKLYSDYDSKEDKSSEISNRQALIDTLSSISSSGKESKEESNENDIPYLTQEEFEQMSSGEKNGNLKKQLMELHLAEVAYGENWKERFKIPDLTKSIEKWNRGVEDAKKVTLSDEEKKALEKKYFDKIKNFIDSGNESFTKLGFDAGKKLFFDDIEDRIRSAETEVENALEGLDLSDENKKKDVLDKINGKDGIYTKIILELVDYLEKCKNSLSLYDENGKKQDENYHRYEEIRNVLDKKLDELYKKRDAIDNKLGNEQKKPEKDKDLFENSVSNKILSMELVAYLSGEKKEVDENWKKISDKDMVIDAIVESLSNVGIEDEEKRNAIVGRASNLLQTLSTEEDSKDLYELLEERITAEIKKLYSDYESKEDKSSEISNRQALIDTLSSISSSSKESKEESHDIELPYLTYDQFKYMSSYKESGLLKQYLMEVHLAEVAYGENWKEKFKIPDLTKSIEKWNRGVEDAKKVTLSDEEKADLRKRCLDEIEGFIGGTKEPNPDLRFAAGLKLLSDSFDIGDSKEKIDGYISVLKSFYDKLNRFKDENKIYGDKYNEYKGKVLEKIDDIYQDKINKINDYITKCRDSEKNCTNDEKSYKRYEEIINMLNHKLKQLKDEKTNLKNEIKNNDFAEKKEKSKDETPKVDEESRKDVLKKKVFAGIAGFTGGFLTAVFAPAPAVAVAGTILLVNRLVRLKSYFNRGAHEFVNNNQDKKDNIIVKAVAWLVKGSDSLYDLAIKNPQLSKIIKAYNNPYFQWALSGFTAGICFGGLYKNFVASQSNATDAKEVASSTRKPSGGNGGTGSGTGGTGSSDTVSAAVSAPSKGSDLDLTHFDASNMHSAYYTSYDANPVSIQSDLFADTKVINTNTVNGQFRVALAAQDGTPLGWFNGSDLGIDQGMVDSAVNSGGIKLL